MFTSLRSAWFTYALLSGIILCVVGVDCCGTYCAIRLPQRVSTKAANYRHAACPSPNILATSTLISATDILERFDSGFDARIVIMTA